MDAEKEKEKKRERERERERGCGREGENKDLSLGEGRAETKERTDSWVKIGTCSLHRHFTEEDIKTEHVWEVATPHGRACGRV